jgi:RNA polymerase sigma factor (sigma-70 family)
MPQDQAAWSDFVQRYGRRIFAWSRKWGLQQDDAEDVTQNVLLDLARQMQDFTYDPSGSFRGWLKTIAYRAWCRLLRDQQKPGARGSEASSGALASLASSEDLLQVLEDECNRELLEHAMARVQLRVQPHVWEAFRLLAIENLSGAEVASRLNIKVSYAFVAKSKVQKMLREEVEQLDRLCGTDG